MSESEQETLKLYIAAHVYLILRMLFELFRNTEGAALGCVVWSGFSGCVNCNCCRERGAGCAGMFRLTSSYVRIWMA